MGTAVYQTDPHTGKVFQDFFYSKRRLGVYFYTTGVPLLQGGQKSEHSARWVKNQSAEGGTLIGTDNKSGWYLRQPRRLAEV